MYSSMFVCCRRSVKVNFTAVLWHRRVQVHVHVQVHKHVQVRVQVRISDTAAVGLHWLAWWRRGSVTSSGQTNSLSLCVNVQPEGGAILDWQPGCHGDLQLIRFLDRELDLSFVFSVLVSCFHSCSLSISFSPSVPLRPPLSLFFLPLLVSVFAL